MGSALNLVTSESIKSLNIQGLKCRGEEVVGTGLGARREIVGAGYLVGKIANLLSQPLLFICLYQCLVYINT